MEPYVGQITLFAGNYAPRGWAFCNGQILAISDYEQLASLIGTTYGGDGRVTFGLPDLRGRIAMGFGSGPGLTPRHMGQRFGSEEEDLTLDQIPRHNHPMQASSAPSERIQPVGSAVGSDENSFGPPLEPDSITALSEKAVADSGAAMPHSNMAPTLGLNYIIALNGVYPARN